MRAPPSALSDPIDFLVKYCVIAGSPSAEADMDTAVVERTVQQQAPTQKTAAAVNEAAASAAPEAKSESTSSSPESSSVVDDKVCGASS